VIIGLLLAAGGARRFGSQKLMAAYRGIPIVRHAAEALRVATDDLVVVVGSEGDAVRRALRGVNLRVVENADWALGLSTSISCGVDALPADTEAVIVAVGDQPQLDPAVVREVIDRWRQSGKSIVSASYRGSRAHPVLFAQSMFEPLRHLHGDAGARLLIERSGDHVSYVEVDAPVPPDVDTPEDLAGLA
jgi:molybdenum cofactor cytidylyltransferase